MTVREGITTSRIDTGRLTVAVHEVEGRSEGRPVVFVHGNVSSSVFFFPVMKRLPAEFRPIAVDLRGFGETDTAPVDATRGLSDFADDVWAAVDALGLGPVALVGWSMGGGVVQQMIIDRPADVTSATLVNPVSPYGFGGTKGLDGEPVSADGAGSGGGTANPDFVRILAEGPARGAADESATSPRATLRAFYVAPGWDGEHEDEFVVSMLSTKVGDDNYPGDSRPSPNWPTVAPGGRGVLNTMAPTQLNLTGIVDADPKPPILWIRGELDQIVSNTSMFDLATLGQLGVVPGWPGADSCPPQPMVGQTRAVLDRYAERGGAYTETVIGGTGHSPHIEAEDEFLTSLLEQLQG